MSFKREGDDLSQLNVLKKRRVADLLSNYIPEDEAALLKNGRYTCLVCSYRPVFDTVDMLTVHRTGKRHLAGLKQFYGKNQQLKNEVEKRRHQDYVKAEEEGRKVEACPAPLLAQTRQITHHALLKSAPYNSCHKTNRPNVSPSQSGVESTSAVTTRPLPSFSVVEMTSCINTIPETLLPEDRKSRPATQKKPVSHKRKDNVRKVSAVSVHTNKEKEEEQRKRLEHYLTLKSSGWIQDRSGNWIKDENVEFDSDEEVPPSLSML
ncbi:sodium channel modifier 1 isoform X1 [Polypterus senegalus]|uniref:sodium channel modifier 1 isoform X1 n=1 Tax=Polypterus senegalus TaxID=55291 RepID=UPI0019664CE7|nr:sodium channel modifier 1 isoform X1 [Polypterus senegalus]